MGAIDQLHENYAHAIGRITSLSPAAESTRIGPFLVLAGGVDVDYFNLATPIEDDGDPAGTMMQIAHWFADRDKPFRFVFREAGHAGFLAAGRSLGLREEGSEPIMVLDPLQIGRVRAAGLVVQPADDARKLALYARVEPGNNADLALREAIARAAGLLPGCRMFLGLADGQPVATSMAVITGSVVGVYNVFVREEYRRRGFGAEITAAALEAGLEHGCTIGTLGSTDMGVSLYLGMGFKTVDRNVSLWSGR